MTRGSPAGRAGRTGRRAWPTVIGAAVLLTCYGCADLPPAGRQMLLTAAGRYSAGQYGAAQQAAETFLRQYPGSPAAAEARYVRGLCRLRAEQPEAARADFAAAAEGAQRPDLRAYALAALGNLAFAAGDLGEAARYYARAEPDLPMRPPADEILYRYGLCLQRAGRWGEARRQFSRVLHHFGDRPAAAGARRAFNWPHDYFAIQCGVFRRADNAERAVADLGRRGIPAKAEYSSVEGEAAWRVLTGMYPTYEQARADLPRVRRAEPSAIIVP